MIKPFFTFCIFSLIILNGCANVGHSVGHSEDMFQSATFTPPVTSTASTLKLDDYVRELVSEMMFNMRSLDSSGTIGVTNFVSTGSDYQSTNQFGYTLADTFMLQLHQVGLDTLDYKVTNYIRVTPQGDFAMSRNYLELDADVPIDYVLVGTISAHKKGYTILARIVDMKSKKILASGESFIPQKLVNMLVSKNHISTSDFTAEATS